MFCWLRVIDARVLLPQRFRGIRDSSRGWNRRITQYTIVGGQNKMSYCRVSRGAGVIRTPSHMQEPIYIFLSFLNQAYLVLIAVFPRNAEINKSGPYFSRQSGSSYGNYSKQVRPAAKYIFFFACFPPIAPQKCRQQTMFAHQVQCIKGAGRN